jgi:hypothetical protein
MRKVLAAILCLTFAIATSTSALAAIEDEQWSQPNAPQLGHHEILIEENAKTGGMASMLSAQKGNNQYLCKTLEDAVCKTADSIQATQVLGVCDASNTIDCIESITAIDAAGKEYPAKFKEYIYYNHPNMFTGDGVHAIKYPLGPSTWTIEGADHSHGNLYTIAVGSMTNALRTLDYKNLYMKFYPTDYGPTSAEQLDSNGIGNIPSCYEKTTNGSSRLFCGESAPHGSYKCAFEIQKNGGCMLQRSFPEGFRFKFSLRLSVEPAGFFHGRLDNPSIEITKLAGKTVNLSVTAGAVKVPILFAQHEWASATDEVKTWWNTCLPTRACQVGTRIPNLENSAEPDGSKRNVLYSPNAYDSRSFGDLDFFRKYISDSSVASPGALNFRTLSDSEMLSANNCFAGGSGVKGFVTTNSTVYSAGPPMLTDGMLTYKVAGLHYAAGGKTLNEGSYDLVLRSDVARCVYKFSSAPIQASISVISAEGEAKTATTTVNESKGWLKLSARGYTYSSPTILVKLSQKPLKKTTITCSKGRLLKKVTAVGPICPAGYKKK